MKIVASLIIAVLFMTQMNTFAEDGDKKKRRGPSPEMKEKLKNMTDEEKKAFKADMKAKRQANGETSEGKKGKCKKGKKKGSSS